jgi:ApbE superfamily uncharacterized protein (UPF0280 family)
MFIEACKDGMRQPDMCRKAAQAAIGFLEQVALDMFHLRSPAVNTDEPRTGGLARAMWRAVRVVGDPDLTPMAAVAGAIADATATFLENQELTRVVVNNGGDVALRLREGETLSVGIRPEVECPDISHRVLITAEMGIRGVATSGLGGRSFTRGVASAATVVSRDAVWADAAATAVANATYISAGAVVRRSAESIYPDTDLKGLDVTVSVGELSLSQIERALAQGLSRAEELTAREVIFGACLFVKGYMAATDRLLNHMEAIT